jgi:hypothetical protein
MKKEERKLDFITAKALRDHEKIDDGFSRYQEF